MITEVRRVMFSKEALVDILEFGRKRGNQRLPPGRIDDIMLENPDAPRVTVKVDVLGGGKFQLATFPQAEFAAMMILYCKANKIPLPRASAKSFEIQGESLCLVVRQQLDREMLTGR